MKNTSLQRPKTALHSESTTGKNIRTAILAVALLCASARAAIDYAVTSVSMNKNSYAPGEVGTMTVVIKNLGSTAATKTSTTEVRFVPQAARPIAQTPEVGKFDVPPLAAGGFHEKQLQFPVPDVANGTFYLWVLADNLSVLGQASTAVENDFGRSAPITVTKAPTTTPVTTAPTNTTSNPTVPATTNNGNTTTAPPVTTTPVTPVTPTTTTSTPTTTQLSTGVIELNSTTSVAGWSTNLYNYGGFSPAQPSGANDGRIRTGGWGDRYEGVLRFDLSGVPKNPTSVMLRLYVLPDDGSPTAVTVHRVTAAWAIDGGGLAFAKFPAVDQPFATIPAPARGTYVDVDVSSYVLDVQAGRYANNGLAFKPVSNSNAYTTFASVTHADATKRPRLVVTSATAAPAAVPASVTITSTAFNLAAGSSLTIEGVVRDSSGNAIANTDVFAEDGFYLQTRILGKTDATGKFAARYDAATSARFGLYAIKFMAGPATKWVVIQVTNTTQPFLQFPAFKVALGATDALTTDAWSLTAKSTPATTTLNTVEQLNAMAHAMSTFVGPAFVEEMKRRSKDPFSYILFVGGVVCVIPASAALVAPACPFVFEEIAEAALDSLFRVTANSIINASTMSADDKALVKQIIDKVDNARSMVGLARSGAVISRFQLYSATWDSASTLWEIKTDAQQRVTQITLTGAGKGDTETRSLVVVPKVPVARVSAPTTTPTATTTTPATTPAVSTGTTGNAGTTTPGTTTPVTTITTTPPATNNGTGTPTSVTNTGTTITPPTTTSNGTTGSSGTTVQPTTPANPSTGVGSLSTAVISTGLGVQGTSVVPPSSRITSVSTLTNAPVTSGFFIVGDAPKTLVIRAVGPGLAQFVGANSVLADPLVRLFDRNGVAVATNDNWSGTDAVSSDFVSVGLFPLARGSKDAALIATVPPGLYTVQASSATSGGNGLVLLEVYELK